MMNINLFDILHYGVLDQHDVTGSWMQAQRPLIVMDAVNTLGDVKIRDIDTKDVKTSLKSLSII